MSALTLANQRRQSMSLPAVATFAQLAHAGVTWSAARGHVRAGRWQRFGRAVVTHNHALTREQREDLALILCGPRSVLTSFTSVERMGLTGWHRDAVHVLVPEGVRQPDVAGIVVHRTTDWDNADIVATRRLHRAAASLVIAAGSCSTVRAACGVLAAGVQQRIVTVAQLAEALDKQPKLRHVRALRLALYDMEQGAQALSEIDFVALCRRHGLPAPEHQAIRTEPNGRRRYLDAHWKRRDGGRLCAEVDGAVHLEPLTWVNDSLRQNEVVLGGTPVLRFPTIVIRSDEALVADQIRRGLALQP